MGRWLAAIVVGAPTTRMLIVVSSLANTGSGVERVSRSAVRKGNFCPILLKTERARRAVQHITTYAAEETEAIIWNPHLG
jgi:hypothetical protein